MSITRLEEDLQTIKTTKITPINDQDKDRVLEIKGLHDLINRGKEIILM